MEHQKIINLLDDTIGQPSKFRTRNWDEINDESKGKYDNSNIRFKTSMIRSNLCDYSDAYILVKRTITVTNAAAAGVAVNNTNKKVIYKNYAPFTDCITEVDNTQVDDAQKIDIVMPIYIVMPIIFIVMLIRRISINIIVCQYYRDGPALNNNNEIIDFPANNSNSASFKVKQQITAQTGNGGTNDV